MSHWKAAFYQSYYTHFGQGPTPEDYRLFSPYGRYLIRTCFPKDYSVKILDLGCGIGGYIKVFQEAGYLNTEGVDASRDNIQFAGRNGIDHLIHDDIFNYVKRATDNSCDIILFLDVLEHFTMEEVIILMGESYRLLRPGGRVIIHVPNASGLFGSKIRYSDITHELAFTCTSLVQLARYAGYRNHICREDKPQIHGILSFMRRVLWEAMSFGYRVMHAAETGSFKVILSQNILFVAIKD